VGSRGEMTSCHASLKRSGLEDKTVFLLESKKFRDAHDVLRYSPIDLVQVLDIPLARAKEIIDTVSSRLASKVERTTALHMKQAELDDPRSVRTGLDTLDSLLKGGLRAGTITEFVGPPGSCKSQLCLQASLFATLPRRLGGLEGKVLYFDAENHFRAERLVQMAQNRFPERYLAKPLLDKLLAHILVASVSSLSHLESMLPNLERTILEHAVRLIVIDNIAVLARTEYSPAETVARQQALGKIASSLKKVACAYRIPVVIANQVMSTVDGLNKDIGAMKLLPSMQAALGAKWAHYVNTRAFLLHTGGRGALQLAKSPFAPETRILFAASEQGVRELDTGEAASIQEFEANQFFCNHDYYWQA